MAMLPGNIDHMFSFTIEKSSEEIKAKIKERIENPDPQKGLEAKIKDRQARIVKLREAYKITDAILVDLLTQARNAQKRGETKMSYSSSTYAANARMGQEREGGSTEEVVVEAGVVSSLMTESDLIEAEKSQVRRLRLIAANLKDVPDRDIRCLPAGVTEIPLRGHQLSYSELEFLGF